MELDVVGFDGGHGRIKCCYCAADGSMRTFSFPSVAQLHRDSALEQSARAFADSPSIRRVNVGNSKFNVDTDPDALPPATVGERNEGDDFAERREYTALLYAALLKIGARRIRLLVLGLPVHLLGKYAESLKERFTGSLQCSDNSPRILVDKVVVLPQPIGSLMYLKALPSRRITSYSTLVMDAGWGTMDWVVSSTEGFKLDHERSGGSPGAGALIYRRIADLLALEYGERFDALDHIDRAVRSNSKLMVHGLSIDLNPFVQQAKEETTVELVRKIRARVRSTEDLGVVLTGGSCSLFADAAREIFTRIPLTTLDEPMMANVRGFVLGGLQSLRSR
ncbi:hypothetical protein FAZ95_37310 [Trinickia violacea]|uniref:Actin-like protein N-terminal domain-containing protein n=1 Tax=Trinickia violacea TaxID=2571746 RepID=A0A4P8J0S9_9BURK|nr:ParM/StbA family protein [Trinickia violacea]QCP54541.1 hypothetical protein FAZ95_37310 [Trinickia violacea]